MTTSEQNEYERRIKKLQREGVLALWQKVVARAPTGWPPGKDIEPIAKLRNQLLRRPYAGPSRAPAGELAVEEGVVDYGGKYQSISLARSALIYRRGNRVVFSFDANTADPSTRSCARCSSSSARRAGRRTRRSAAPGTYQGASSRTPVRSTSRL